MSEPHTEQNEAFALIIDASSSAEPYLDKARRMAERIYDLTSKVDDDGLKLFMLGGATPISRPALCQTSPPGVRRQYPTCSLIAPTMEALARDGLKRSVIIVGNGEIFDLDDWTGDPRVDGWLLVRVGGRSLQGPQSRVSEITEEQLRGNVETLLSYFTRLTPETAAPPRSGDGARAYRWKVDPSGYPLIYVEPLEAYVQLFPVSKPQFEKCIASDKHREFDDKWYEEILALNPRASYRSPDAPPRERLFMTGITPEEASAFGRWMGREYALLTAEEWRTCYEWFGERAATPAPSDLLGRLSQDALAIWDTVEGQWLDRHRQPSLRELSLMAGGVLEWVVERTGRHCALGEPAASKLQRRFDEPLRPFGSGRLKNLGFRLRTR